MKEETRGRPPRTKDIVRTHKLRKDGLSLREISWAVLKREDTKTIIRWLRNYTATGDRVPHNYPIEPINDLSTR